MKISTNTVLFLLSSVTQQSNAFTTPLPSSLVAAQRGSDRQSAPTVLRMQLDPTFVQPDMSTIEEVACQETAARMKRVLVPISQNISPTGSVGISYVHWPSTRGSSSSSLSLILVHGFDSSALEYRRLGSRLAARGIDTYAVDLLGWGYSQLQNVSSFSAAAKVEALESFARTILEGKPFCIAGASLGGAAAIELAASNTGSCRGLILIDAQGFVDGIGPMASLPTPLASLGVQILKSVPLRSSANQMSYFDKESYATDEAVRIGRLHCLQDGWSEALVSFMQSGGFSPSQKVPSIEAPALILWGRQDTILDGDEFANKFVEQLPNANLRWIEECGHVPHLEQPDQTADAIQEYMSKIAPPTAPTIPNGIAFAAAGVTAVIVGAVNLL